MDIEKKIKKFAEDNDIQLKSWQIDNFRRIGRKITDDVSEDEIMETLHDEFKKTGFFLKDKSYRDLKKRLF